MAKQEQPQASENVLKVASLASFPARPSREVAIATTHSVAVTAVRASLRSRIVSIKKAPLPNLRHRGPEIGVTDTKVAAELEKTRNVKFAPSSFAKMLSQSSESVCMVSPCNMSRPRFLP